MDAILAAVKVLRLTFALIIAAALPVDGAEHTGFAHIDVEGFGGLVLRGDARLDPSLSYVSFAGDFGFRRDPVDLGVLLAFADRERKLLDRFDLSVVNMEYLYAGTDASAELDSPGQLSQQLLARSGFELVAVANNHALDEGSEGLTAAIARLEEEGFAVVGERSRAVFHFDLRGVPLTIISATNFTDVEDPEGRIFLLESEDIRALADQIPEESLAIAFVHLGSISVYPSPHEFARVRELAASGFDLVICSGNHLVRGFSEVEGVPVFWGTGNHLFSTGGENTEPIGAHIVAGFRDRSLEQLLVFPFDNAVLEARVGPVSGDALARFGEMFAERSAIEEGAYFRDPLALQLMLEQIRKLSPEKLTRLRPRHVRYAVGIAWEQGPGLVLVGGMVAIAGTACGFRLVSRWRAGRASTNSES